MARKFSLKDNPIFQRLEVPKPRLVDDDVEATSDNNERPTTEIDRPEGQILTLKNRPSEIDPQPTGQNQERGPREQDNEVEVSEIKHPTALNARTQKIVEGSEGKKSESADIDMSMPAGVTGLVVSNTEEHKSPSEDDALKDIYNRGSEFDPQNLRLSNQPTNLSSDETSEEVTALRNDVLGKKQDSQKSEQTLGQQLNLSLVDHIEKSQFFTFYNEVTDGLLPTLNPAEQILYSRLFRLSYGFNKNYCTVSQQLLRERTGLSRNTIRIGLQSLVLQEWLHVVDAGNHVSTTYRVVLPRERNRRANSDPQEQTLKNRPSKFEAQKRKGKFRGSKNDVHEGQKTEVQNLTLKNKNEHLVNKIEKLNDRGSNSDPQGLTPLHITNNSLTLSERENRFHDSKDNRIAVAQQIVDEFYTQLSQRPASTKRQKSVSECVDLLRDGFSVDQLRYAVHWTVAELPGTGSFSRVVHFIDQALKAYKDGEKVVTKQRSREAEHDQRRVQEKQREEEEKRIDDIRRSLPLDEIEKLTVEATQLVEQEHGDLRFGRETLIQIKIRELLRRNHFTS